MKLKIEVELSSEEFIAIQDNYEKINKENRKFPSLFEFSIPNRNKDNEYELHLKKKRPALQYTTGDDIEEGDTCIIVPAEFAVTNADVIQYDQSIDGMAVEVLSINVTEKEITVKELKKKREFKVHPQWLSLTSKPIKK